MLKTRHIKRLPNKQYFSCQMCGNSYKQFPYEYRPTNFIYDYKPQLLKLVCKKCIYREIFGSKNANKEMKKGSLDGEEE